MLTSVVVEPPDVNRFFLFLLENGDFIDDGLWQWVTIGIPGKCDKMRFQHDFIVIADS